MRWLPWLAALLAAAACDSQVDGEYAGEPLLVFSGVVVATVGSSVDTLVLRWSTSDPAGPGEQESHLGVALSSLNGFSAAIVADPPAGARRGVAPGEPRFAEGYLFAVDDRGRTVGADFERGVVWLESAAAAGSPTAALLGGPLAAGYHVMDRGALADAPPERAPLVEQCVERALVEGWDEARAALVCRLTQAYRLVPARLDERWVVHASGAP